MVTHKLFTQFSIFRRCEEAVGRRSNPECTPIKVWIALPRLRSQPQKALLAMTLLSVIFLSGCGTSQMSLQKSKEIEAAYINVELGMQYFQQGDYQKANEKFLAAREQAPKDPLVYNALGLYLEKVGETQKAEGSYKQALSLNPNDGATNNNYGTFLCRKGDTRSAISYFLKATKDPQYPNIAKAYENAGLCAMKSKDNKQAKAFFEKALAYDPKTASALLGLSELRVQDKDYTTAQYYLQRFLEVSPPTYDALQLGVKINKVLKNSKAQSFYQELLTQNFPEQKAISK